MIQHATKAFDEWSDWRLPRNPEEWRAARLAELEGQLQDPSLQFEHPNLTKDMRFIQEVPAEKIAEYLQAKHDEETNERATRWESICHGTRYEECTLGNFEATCDKQREAVATITEFRNALPHHVRHGTNLLLYGTCGSGKDHLLAALLKTIVLDLRWHFPITWTTGFKIAATAKAELGSGLRRPTSVLAISDPVYSGETAMFYTQQRLHELIDTQYSAGRPVWITVNCSGRKQLDSMLGPQLSDRICDGAVLVPCFWPSFRKPRAEQPKYEAPENLVSEQIA